MFIGSSGSGKSTLMNIIGCLDTPTSGRYVLADRDVSHMTENELADIRNQEIRLHLPELQICCTRASALRNVMQPLIYRGMSLAERRAEAERVARARRARGSQATTCRTSFRVGSGNAWRLRAHW